MVETGADPEGLGRALLQRLPAVIEGTQQLVERVQRELPPLDHDGAEGDEGDDEEDDDDGGDGDEVLIGERRLPPGLVERIAAEAPFPARCWWSLGEWCLPTVACLSRAPGLRTAARQDATLAPAVARLDEQITGSELGYVRILLAVLDDEPLLVLHPTTRQGFRCRMGGVSSNFQLHVLLMDALIAPAPAGLLGRLRGRSTTGEGRPGGLPGPRPKRSWVELVRGVGPAQGDEGVRGLWNLYNWAAIDAQGHLPPPADLGAGSDHMIWGEGEPADIVPFEGLRVVLLGPPSYERSWGSARTFAELKAYLEVEEELTAEAVTGWLGRFASAPPRPARPGRRSS